jgi:hypothetical protein
MKLSEVFEQLSVGELSQLSLGGGEVGRIDPSNYGKVIAHLNLGLTSLYTRFCLKEGELIVPLVPDQLSYSLSAPDLLKVERVFDATGKEWALNDEANLLACRSISPSVLKIPAEFLAQNGLMRLEYRANHPRVVLEYGYIDPDNTELELPYSHLQALLYFIASRCHNPVGMTNEFHAGNSYYAKYEAECMRLESESLDTDQGGQYNRLRANGWV